MPIYEFECESCKHKFEEWLKVSEAHTEQVCPKCKAKAKRVISNTSFILKGEGWYVTEYGSKKNTEHTKEHHANATTESETTTKTESKTEVKAENSQATSSSSEQVKPKSENKAEKAKKGKTKDD